MAHKKAEIRLTEKEIKFCILKYQDELTDAKIAQEIGISARTVYEWVKRPEIQAEIDQLGKADTQKAFRFFQKNAMGAAKAIMKLIETTQKKDKRGNIRQTFIQPGEVVRRAAADILQAVKIEVKGPERSEEVPNILIYLPDNKRK